MLGTVIPNLLNAAMKLPADLLPKGQSTMHRTGAESHSLFDKSTWKAPFRGANKVMGSDLYQVPKYDAKFNMGLKKLHLAKAGVHGMGPANCSFTYATNRSLKRRPDPDCRLFAG